MGVFVYATRVQAPLEAAIECQMPETACVSLWMGDLATEIGSSLSVAKAIERWADSPAPFGIVLQVLSHYDHSLWIWLGHQYKKA